MSYAYDTEKQALFTDAGQRMFLQVRDNVRRLLDKAGAVRMAEAISGVGGGDSWALLACVDRLVELREIREVTPIRACAGQDRVFVKWNWA